jgi:hypothetical protein
VSDEALTELRVTMGSIERRGAWIVPEHLDVRVMWGSAELDLRDAKLSPGLTTIDVQITMGNVEIIVAPGMTVNLDVRSVAGNVAEGEHITSTVEGRTDGPRIRVTGKVKLGNCEVITLHPGETRSDGDRRRKHVRHQGRHDRHHGRHRARHARFRELHAEREMWMRSRDPRRGWQPWWLMARMRRRMFIWFTLAFAAGIATGVRLWPDARWWHLVIALVGLSMASSRPASILIGSAARCGCSRWRSTT